MLFLWRVESNRSQEPSGPQDVVNTRIASVGWRNHGQAVSSVYSVHRSEGRLYRYWIRFDEDHIHQWQPAPVNVPASGKVAIESCVNKIGHFTRNHVRSD